MRFLWLTTHGMLLHFLCYSEIWYLHDIFLVNDTWHAVAFPIATVQNLKIFLVNDTWHAIYYIAYTVQKFDIYMKFPWSKCSHISHDVQNLDVYMRFTVVFLCEKVHSMYVKKPDTSEGKNNCRATLSGLIRKKSTASWEHLLISQTIYNKYIKILT